MNDIALSIRALLLRDLRAIQREVQAYPDEASLWARPGGVPNATGSLALHIAGNMRHFIGARLGGSSYIRDRQREFGAPDIERRILLAELDEAVAEVERVLPLLTSEQLASPFPEAVGGRRFVTSDFLMHLCAHAAYHLGQIDYHRRVVTGQSESASTLPLSELYTAKAD